jgi:hypothetical protein
MEYVKGVFMAVYAVYEADGFLPVFVSRTQRDIEVWDYTTHDIVRYDHLTQKQVELLPYATAKAYEAVLEEYNATTLQ